MSNWLRNVISFILFVEKEVDRKQESLHFLLLSVQSSSLTASASLFQRKSYSLLQVKGVSHIRFRSRLEHYLSNQASWRIQVSVIFAVIRVTLSVSQSLRMMMMSCICIRFLRWDRRKEWKPKVSERQELAFPETLIPTFSVTLSSWQFVDALSSWQSVDALSSWQSVDALSSWQSVYTRWRHER